MRHADRLRDLGIDVSIVDAYAPSGQSMLTGRSCLSPANPQLYVLHVPRAQAEAARNAPDVR